MLVPMVAVVVGAMIVLDVGMVAVVVVHATVVMV